MDVAKIGINVEAKGVKQTFDELDKLAKSSTEVSKQMDKLIPLLTRFTNVDISLQAGRLKAVSTEMAAFAIECNKMATAVGQLKVTGTGLNDLKNVLSGLSKISSGGLEKHAANVSKLTTALSSGNTFTNASTQIAALNTSLSSLATTPQTLSQIAKSAGEFKGKSTSLNNFTASIERLALVSGQLPKIATEIGLLAPALSNMTGVSQPVAMLVAQLKALQGHMTATVGQANAATTQTSGVSRRASTSSAGDTSGFGGTLGVGTMVSGAVAGLALSQMSQLSTEAIKLADQMNNMRAKVSLVTGSQQELVQVQAQLLAGSNYVGTSLQTQTDAYVQLSRSTAQLSLSQAAVVDLTTKLSMAHKVGGGDASSFNSAIVQLNQGLASGVLRGQEFNSMAEQAPVVLQALRIGLEKTGEGVNLTTGSLRKMAGAGKLTTDIVIPALQIGLESIKKQFDALPVSVERSMEVLKNNTAVMLDKVNQQTGATVALSDSLQSMAKFVENNTGLFVAMGNALPILAVGLLSIGLGKLGNAATASFGSIGSGAIKAAQAEVVLTEATLAETNAQVKAALVSKDRVAALMAQSAATIQLAEAQAGLATATAITTRAATGLGVAFSAIGGWSTVVIGGITLLIMNWDKLAAALGNVAAQADNAEAAQKRAAAAKSLPALVEVGQQLDKNIVNAKQKYEEKRAIKGDKDLQARGVVVSELDLAESFQALKKAEKQKEDNDKMIENFKIDSITNNYKAPPISASGKLIEDLTAMEQAKLEKGKKLRLMYEKQKADYMDMSRTKEARDKSFAQMTELTTKDASGKTPLEREAAFDKIVKPKSPKGLTSIQSRDSAANADYKAALQEQVLLQNNSAESLDKLTTSGKKALQVETQLAEAKKAVSKVGKEVISSLERDLGIYKKTAIIQEGNILTRKKEAAATLEASKTADVLSASLVRTNEFLSARDELIRSGNVAEVVEADQKKLLAMRKAFMLELAKIDREIAESLSSKETAALIERRTGLKANFDKVNQQVGVPADKFNMKTIEGVRGMEAKSMQESTASFERGKTELAGQMGEASSSDVQKQLGDEYNNMLEAQKQREIDIHQSADEKIKSIEKEKTDRQMAMLKTAESFANTMMDITSNEGKDRLAKEKENFKSQSGLYKAFFLFKQATAIAQATVAGTIMAAEMAAWGAAMAGPVGAAAGQAIGYGIMGANIGMIAGQTIGMFAKGSAFDGGGVVSSPTAFSHGGGKGVMGEAGPEGILPLATGPDGKLGVQMYGGDKSNGGGVSKITIVNQTTGRIDSVEEKQISPTERQIIIKEAIETMNGNLANPNSSTSKAMNSNYVGMRRNR